MNFIQTVNLLYQPTLSSSTSPKIGLKSVVIPLYCANTWSFRPVLHRALSGHRFIWDRNDHAEHAAYVGLSAYLEGPGAAPCFAANSVGGLIKGINGKKEPNRISSPCFVAWCKPGLLYPWLPRTTIRSLHKVIATVWLGNPPQLSWVTIIKLYNTHGGKETGGPH